MNDPTALLLTLALAPLFSIVALSIAVLFIVMMKDFRKNVFFNLCPRPPLLWCVLWLSLTIFLNIIVIAGAVGGEMLIAVAALFAGLDVVAISLYSAGPIEETTKAIGALVLVLIFYMVSKERVLDVRIAMTMGFLIGTAFGTLEALLYLFQGVHAMLLDPSFFTIDVVIWRIAFGAVVHGLFCSLTVWPMGLSKVWHKIAGTLGMLFIMAQVHGGMNLVNLIASITNPNLVDVLIVDGIQFFIILTMAASFLVIWHKSRFWGPLQS